MLMYFSNDLTATQLHSKLPQDDMELLIEAQVSESRVLKRAYGITNNSSGRRFLDSSTATVQEWSSQFCSHASTT
jgi:hypothetical protein